jgi:hypothetical protein
MSGGCPSDDTRLGSFGTCFVDDEWDLAYFDDYFGPGSEEDVGPVDEQNYCVGGHPECADCSKDAPTRPVHPDEPEFEDDAEYIYCLPGSSCRDGEVYWLLFNEVETGWQACNPNVPGCYDEITVSEFYEDTDSYYYWCNS